jgi:hypothetical protein
LSHERALDYHAHTNSNHRTSDRSSTSEYAPQGNHTIDRCGNNDHNHRNENANEDSSTRGYCSNNDRNLRHEHGDAPNETTSDYPHKSDRNQRRADALSKTKSMYRRNSGARSQIHDDASESSHANAHRSYGARNSLHEHAYASNQNERFAQAPYCPHASSDVEFEEQRSTSAATQSKFAAEYDFPCLDDCSRRLRQPYFAQPRGAPWNAD